MKENSGRTYLIISVVVADLLALTAGMMISWSSPVNPKLEKPGDDNPLQMVLTSDETSWIGSLLSLGAAIGPFLVALSAELVGRKWTLVGLAVPFLFAYLVLAFATEVGLFYAARAIAGLSVGGLFTLLPTYLAEISDDAVRGAMGTSMNVLVCTGQLLAYSIGPYVSIMVFSLLCAIVPAVFIVIFSLLMSETPQYLISRGKVAEAKASFDKLRGGRGDSNEFEEMRAFLKANARGSLGDLFQISSNVKALLISIGLVCLQQLSGITVVLFYTQQIFDATKSSIPSEVSPIIIGVVQAIASLITPIFVDKYGRKIILMLSAIGMVIAQVPLGLYFYLDDVDDIGWLPVLCLVVYIAAYGFGTGILPWTLMAELLPNDVKAYASAITASICWTASFLITKFFGSISDEIGMSGTFWLFAVFNTVSIAFTMFIVPETKGKSFQQIQEMLNR